MQTTQLDLDPQGLSFHGYGTETLGERVSQGYAELFGFKIAKFLARDHSFTHAELKADIVNSVYSSSSEALSHCLNSFYQRSHYLSEDHVNLFKALGTEPGDDIDLAQISLPQGFLTRLKCDVAASYTNFSILADIHERSLLNTKIPQLLQDVLDCFDESNNLNFKQAFNAVRTYISDPSIAIDLDQIGDLHCLLYLPDEIRYVVQDAILVETAVKMLDNLRLEYQDPVSTNFIDEVVDYLRHSVFLNSHWERLQERYNTCLEVSEMFSNFYLEEIHKLEKLQKSVMEGNNKQIVESFLTQTATIYTKAVEVENTSQCRIWMRMDSGHGFLDYLVMEVERFCSEYANLLSKDIQKTGRKAIVFEDDSRFGSKIRGLINDYSSLLVPPDSSGVCTTPEAVESWIEDPEVACFLLDIQNPSDHEAGIKLAKNILKRRFEMLNRLSEEEIENYPHTSIYVWSNSNQAVKKAHNELGRLQLKLNDQSDLISGLGSYFSSPISIEVSTKACDLTRILYNLNRKN